MYEEYRVQDFPDHLEVIFTLPRNTRSKDVDVVFGSTTIKAGLRGQKSVVEGKLYGPISATESMWQIDGPTGDVSLHLEKDNSTTFGSRWPILIVSPSVAGQLNTIDAHSAYLLSSKLEHENLLDEAFKLLKYAVEQKHTFATRKLFSIYLGKDVIYGSGKKDLSKALALADSESIKSHRDCQQIVGFLYADGDGDNLKRDVDKAIEWLKRAVDQRDEKAQVKFDDSIHLKLGDLLLEKQQHSEALLHYERLLNIGNAEAHHRMALALLPPNTPNPTSRVLAQARQHIDAAAKAGVVIPATTRERLADGERVLEEERKAQPFLNPYLTVGVVLLVGIMALEFRKSMK